MSSHNLPNCLSSLRLQIIQNLMNERMEKKSFFYFHFIIDFLLLLCFLVYSKNDNVRRKINRIKKMIVFYLFERNETLKRMNQTKNL